ncbi:hypothetical protein [Corallococcus exercitus]|uniref:Lipoprotein n=1 Tax=Corallococcus exercitus TaxID=2316736 RepID=A0A7Y4JP95_9BACT|nr:hypothetical protein [Corallococcus exercitus]NOK07772.1 hypothetical protein [Corallococcus exercitus]
MERRNAFTKLRGVLVLGALLTACGPVPDTEAPVEDSTGQDVTAMSRTPAPQVDPMPLATSEPAVAYGWGRFLVVWEDVREGGVYGTLVRKNGTLVSPAGFRINIGTGPGGTPSIAYDGDQFMVLWKTEDSIRGVRVKTDGTVVGPVFNVITSGRVAGPVGIACSSRICLVTFTVNSDTGSEINARRVTTDGVVLPELVHGIAPGARLMVEATVAWNGTDFFIAWSDSRGGELTPDIYGARVKPDGTLVDPGGLPIAVAPGAQRSPDVVWTGRRFLVVWSDGRGADRDIYGARVRSNGRLDDPQGIPIATGTGDQLFPAVAHHNSKSLVVWQSDFDGLSRVRGVRVHEDGTVMAPGVFAISSSDYEREALPDVAYGGGLFLTAYSGSSAAPSEPTYILSARVDHQARVLDVDTLTRASTLPSAAP